MSEEGRQPVGLDVARAARWMNEAMRRQAAETVGFGTEADPYDPGFIRRGVTLIRLGCQEISLWPDALVGRVAISNPSIGITSLHPARARALAKVLLEAAAEAEAGPVSPSSSPVADEEEAT